MKLVNDNLERKAYLRVKDMILKKQLLPGHKIVQDKLAEDLGISRTPLRSALQMLEAEYLLESLPTKGVVVKKFTDREIVEIYDCRIALEGTAIRLFTTRSNPSKLRKLFEPFLPGDWTTIDNQAYRKADSQFHDYIISKCGNEFLRKLFHQGNLLVCINLIGLVRPPHETLPEHMEIIAAIEKKDADLAEKLAKEHLDISKQLILQKMKSNE
ncbi:GntR family transcriptional regulator [Fulvivirgaceae bacterium BMA12]|uniref:GntR family transcriptional regulator n=1 Tax=Agaribacillus aureus TaxID=3051825 RepID=A0ABT8L8L0_9BACT|nr:GntR family transcriptional regulator [Fulvivirgaceae bacterium BMA12]